MKSNEWNEALLAIICAAGPIQTRLERALDALCQHLTAHGAFVFAVNADRTFSPLASSIRVDEQRAAFNSLFERLKPTIEWFVCHGGPDIAVQTPTTAGVFSPRTLRSGDTRASFGLFIDSVSLDLADRALAMAEQVTGWYAGSVEHFEVHRAERRRYRVYEEGFRRGPHPAVVVDSTGTITDANLPATELLVCNDEVEALCGTPLNVWLSEQPAFVRASGETVRLCQVSQLDGSRLIWITRAHGD